jgi:SPP1 family predicted phage head-tail adaptor
MMKSNVVDLITVSPEAGGVGTEPAETKRTVFCTVRSIGQQEAYLAMGQGLNPELKVILAHDFEYDGEGLCELDGKRYQILRTYITEADGIELTLQRVTRNAGHLPDPEPVNTETVNTETAGSAEGVG